MEENNVVFRTLDFMEATMVKSLLEGSGVEVFMYDENVSRLNPIYSSVVGGIRLLVPDGHLQKAREVLSQYRQREEESGSGQEETDLQEEGE